LIINRYSRVISDLYRGVYGGKGAKYHFSVAVRKYKHVEINNDATFCVGIYSQKWDTGIPGWTDIYDKSYVVRKSEIPEYWDIFHFEFPVIPNNTFIYFQGVYDPEVIPDGTEDVGISIAIPMLTIGEHGDLFAPSSLYHERAYTFWETGLVPNDSNRYLAQITRNEVVHTAACRVGGNPLSGNVKIYKDTTNLSNLNITVTDNDDYCVHYFDSYLAPFYEDSSHECKYLNRLSIQTTGGLTDVGVTVKTLVLNV